MGGFIRVLVILRPRRPVDCWRPEALKHLSPDLRRMLKVQWKTFIDCLEEAEMSPARADRKAVEHLERCFTLPHSGAANRQQSPGR
ncbi:MAG TPA: hypothetical protein V6D08_01945 [Candidatus Obscuribacterales bacterium]